MFFFVGIEVVFITVFGGYIMAGRGVDGNGIDDAWLVKTDASGAQEWFNLYGGPGSSYDEACSVEQTSGGGYLNFDCITATSTSDACSLVRYEVTRIPGK